MAYILNHNLHGYKSPSKFSFSSRFIASLPPPTLMFAKFLNFMEPTMPLTTPQSPGRCDGNFCSKYSPSIYQVPGGVDRWTDATPPSKKLMSSGI